MLSGVDIIGSAIGRDGVRFSQCGVFFYTTSMQHPTAATSHHSATIPTSLQNSSSGRLRHGLRHGLLPGLRRPIATAAEATQPLAQRDVLFVQSEWKNHRGANSAYIITGSDITAGIITTSPQPLKNLAQLAAGPFCATPIG